MQDAKFNSGTGWLLFVAFFIMTTIAYFSISSREKYIRKYEDQVLMYESLIKQTEEQKRANDSLITNLRVQYDSLSEVKRKVKIIYHEKLVYIDSYTVFQLDSLIRSGFKR